MNSHAHPLRASLLALAALGLAACSDDGSRQQGIEVSLTATPVGTAHAHDDEAAKHSEESYVTFRRADGTRIDLQLGLLNLVPVELVACEATVSARLLDLGARLNPIATAQAHAGHEGEAPEGFVSVVGGDASDLGSLVAMPGEYCALVVELQPGGVEAGKHGDSLDTSMSGAAVNVAPCYYPGTVGLSDADALAATAHSCIQAKYSGEARRVTLNFAKPLTLDGSHRQASLDLVVRYEDWFEGVDFTKLASDAAQQAKVADNVAASLHVVGEDEQLVNLAFALEVNGHEAVCGQAYSGLGSTAQPLRVEGFRYYASDFALENASGSVPVRLAAKANGTVYQGAAHNVALLGHAQGCDAPQPLRNLSLSGSAPAGEYDRLCFDLGVPFDLNHSDVSTAPSPLNVTALDWSWLFGRIFLRFDALVAGEGDGGGMEMKQALRYIGKHGDEDHGGEAEAPVEGEFTQNFFVHLGSTGCSNGASDFGAPPAEECTYPNRPRICLDYASIAEGHPIVADIAPVISELDITYNTPDTAPGCMAFPGDPECATVIPKFNLDFALAPDQLIPRQDQALFKVGE
ncbi:MAG TPA: MbnP family copper-binding protein [Fontimonas sp.]